MSLKQHFYLCVAMGWFSSSIFAQGTVRGAILGTVTDPTGAVVFGASVTLTNVGTLIHHSSLTNDAGIYTYPNLPVGNYRITVQADGFRGAVVENIRLEVGATYRADITLEIGEVTSQVTVEATTPLLRTDDAEVSHVIEQKMVADLPLNGRDFQQLQLLTPGSVNTVNFQTGAGLGGGAATVSANVALNVSNGSRPGGQLFLIDGGDVTNQQGRSIMVLPNVDEIEEFRVSGSNFSAEYGYGTNVVNVSTKSGTNDFHGALWAFNRNDRLAARSFFATTVGDLKRNQFGGAIGGPIIRNRSFFFFTYEGQRERAGRQSNATVPTERMRGGDLSELAARIYDPQTSRLNPQGIAQRDPFPGNLIPPARLDSISTLFLDWIPLPNSPGLVGNFRLQPVAKDDYNGYTTRVDHRLSDKDSLMGRWTFRPTRAHASIGPYHGFSRDPYDPGTSLKETGGTSAVVSWTRGFSATTLLDTKISLGRSNVLVNNVNQIQGGVDWTDQAGIQGFGKGVSDQFASFPSFSIAGFTGLPSGAGFPFVQNSINYGSSLFMLRGKHSIKMGQAFRFYQQNTNPWGHSGMFSFNGGWTSNPAAGGVSGSGFADYLLGVPFDGGRRIPPGAHYRRFRNSWSYFQDDWKISPNLTLNLGIRYELNFPAIDKYDQNATWVPNGREGRGALVVSHQEAISEKNFGLHPALGLTLPTYRPLLVFADDVGIPRRALRHTHYKQFGPRFGLAWRARREVTVRLGYGIYFNQLDGNRATEAAPPPITIREGNVLNPPDGNGSPSRGIRTLFPLESRFDPIPTVSAHDPWNRGFGETQQWNFAIQKLLPGRLSLEGAYVGTKGDHLQTSRQFNAPVPGPGVIQPRRPYPEFASIAWNEHAASSIYHSFQTKVERRFQDGLTVLGAFTWSKALDDSSESSQGRNPFINRFDRGRSSFDVPFSFSLSTVYELPFFEQSPSLLARYLISGWTVAGILTLQSGFPYTPAWAGDTSNTGLGARPVRICDGRANNPTILQWFDPSCFIAPAQFTFGNSGRNILRGDSYENLDFAVYKNIDLRETQRLQFRAEFFNALNHPTFALPRATINAPGPGQIIDASPGRILQFGVKYRF